MEKINLQQAPVAVIGAGTMGIGIAQLAAMHGHPTFVYDVDASKTEAALQQLAAQLTKRVQAGKMTQELYDSTFANLSVAQELAQLAPAQLIIEAIVEKKEVKQSLFNNWLQCVLKMRFLHRIRLQFQLQRLLLRFHIQSVSWVCISLTQHL